MPLKTGIEPSIDDTDVNPISANVVGESTQKRKGRPPKKKTLESNEERVKTTKRKGRPPKKKSTSESATEIDSPSPDADFSSEDKKEWVFPLKMVGSSMGMLIPSDLGKRLSLSPEDDILLRVEYNKLVVHLNPSTEMQGYRKRFYFSGRVSLYLIFDTVIANLIGLEKNSKLLFSIVNEKICTVSVYDPSNSIDAKMQSGIEETKTNIPSTEVMKKIALLENMFTTQLQEAKIKIELIGNMFTAQLEQIKTEA